MTKRREISQEEYDALMEDIIASLMTNGVKSTTMDSIATSRQMSKRTLYEIFTSKEQMFQEACEYFHKKIARRLKEIFESSENIMESIVRCFLYNRDLMSNLNAEFIRNINQYFIESQKNKSNQSCSRPHHLFLYDILKRGVEEGFFIDTINLMVHCRMLGIQMESLKRMEEIFPPDITLLEVYDSITLGFLRGLCTSKGLEELDRILNNESTSEK